MLGSQANLNNATTMKTKKCSVCGDKAVGMNYNGLTCVSCRTFFTRSATKTGVLKCPKLNNCEIDLATRKSCPACRLKKSFAVGMRLKGRPNSTANSTSSSTEQSSSSTPQDTPDNSTDNSTDSSDSSALVACSPPQLSLSSSSPRSSQSTTSTNATNLDHLLHRNIASILSSLAIDNNPLIEHLYPETLHLNPLHRFAANRRRHFALDLNFREREIIAELQHAMNIAFVEEASLPEVRSTTDLVEVLSWPRIYSKRIVKFCKSIRIKVENGNFFVRLQAEMANDPTLRDLIIGQFFYQPRPGISCPEYIRQQYFLYTYILRRYLEHKYKNLNLATRKFNS
ncbi:zinc ion binding [Tyrophagus putrescentiae]|nr:zinc ion binding [Tyrophagus putrescentiae]